ncbi:MAG: WG repeat-containing protein [Bacteroidetes bacterium]|nr:WG repeat-containing protein [Bacteroidota bacterium]
MKKICTAIFIIMLNPIFFFSHAQGNVNSQRLLPVQVNGVWGFINLAGKIVITPQFDSAEEFSEGLAAVQVGDAWGYADSTGLIIINPEYDYAGKFSDGLAVVQADGNFGYINKSGDLVIPPQFVSAEDFENEIASVMMKMENQPAPKHSYIDKTGKPITEFDVVNLISDGLILVRNEYKKGFIDASGKIIIPLIYDDAKHFKEGFAAVKENDKWGFIEKSGKYILPPKFDLMKDEFSEGTIGVQVDRKWGFISNTGELQINPIYDDVGSFSEGLAIIAQNGKQGYIDKTGKIIIEPVFKKAFNFENGIARIVENIESKDAWKLIDKTSKQIGSTLFVKDINHFEDGVACVRTLDNKYNYIDRQGNFLSEIKYDRAEPWFHNGVAQVFIGKKMGYIDKTGRYIWRPSE